MSNTFASRPARVSQSQRGRGRGGIRSRDEEAVLVGTGLAPSGAAASSRGTGARGRAGRGTAIGNRGGGGSVGRGRGGGRGQLTDPGMRGGVGGKVHTSSRSTLQERTMHAGGFTVIRPDEKRRREVTEQAEREAQRYEQYKQQGKPARVSYVGTVGGGEGSVSSLERARQQQVRTQVQHSKASRLVRDQDRRSQHRQEEDRAMAQRKEVARKQTNLHAQRQTAKQDGWKSEMNRVNQAFLDRLEAQAKQKGPSSEQT
ncbi:hypothetical protein ACOMHN_031905 [Nucella lapillus]